VLTFEDKCSYFRVKPARLVGHLPAFLAMGSVAMARGDLAIDAIFVDD
jgi:hypothetical protein